MPYVIEVDQSGKIEDTATDTVLAFSNGKSYAVLIPATTKRACIQQLRRRGKSGKSLYWRLFTKALFLLLKDHMADLITVTIDDEYTGHSAPIKQELLRLLWGAGVAIDPGQIRFGLIQQGKQGNPPAHEKAYSVHRGNEKPDRVLTVGELIADIK
jgi:hypothetical protein